MKPENVQIIQITCETSNHIRMIYGLGDDSLVYFWRADTHTWEIWG